MAVKLLPGQPTLFNVGQAKRLARRGDPATSKEAARSVELHAETQKAAIYRILEEGGEATAGEIGRAMGYTTNPNLVPCKRLKAMEGEKLIERRPARPCAITGNSATVWRVKG